MAGHLTEIAGGQGFVESPRWRDGRLFYSDFGARRVKSVGLDGDVRNEAWVPGQPSGLGFTPEGDMLIVSAHDGHILRHGPGGHMILADIGTIYRGPLNDMLTLPNGDSYVSALPAPVVGRVAPPIPADGGDVPLFLVRPGGAVEVVAEHIRIPNGIAASHDGTTLFVAEIFGNCVLAYDIAPNGSLTGRRVHADLEGRSPDGIAIDSRGRIWVGCPYASEFVRVDEAGRIDASIPVSAGAWAVAPAIGRHDDEIWCAVNTTSIPDYLDGRACGAIHLWQKP